MPVAVGRTAGAVGGLADSGAIIRLTRGRLWIGLLAALLVGIVALNVGALRFNATSGEAARAADALRQQNSTLRAQLATVLTQQELEETVAVLGLHLPAAGDVRYRTPSPGDAAEVARRLRSGELHAAGLSATAVVPAPSEPVPAAPLPAGEPLVAEPATESAPATVAEPVATGAPVSSEAQAPSPAPLAGGAVSAP